MLNRITSNKGAQVKHNGHLILSLSLLSFPLTGATRQESCVPVPGSQFNACQLFSTWQDAETGKAEVITAATKYNTPLGSRVASNRMKTSYTRTQTHKNHPSGGQLFPQDGALAQQLDSFLDSVEAMEQIQENAVIALKRLNDLTAQIESQLTTNKDKIDTVETTTKERQMVGVEVGSIDEELSNAQTVAKQYPGNVAQLQKAQRQLFLAWRQLIDTIHEQDPPFAKALHTPIAKIMIQPYTAAKQQFEQGKDSYFITYFSRLQITIQHELYQYLLSIYTAFNMTHISDVWDFVKNEETQALNKKTMIINHLVSIIEAQANQAISQRFPNLPQHLATRTGAMMMKHDYGADLNLMIEGEELRLFEDPNVQGFYKARRELYTEIFGKYLKFFKNYTATLQEDDPIYGTKFVKHAQDIQKVINAAKPPMAKTGSIQDKIRTLRSIKTINPPLFFYDEQALRGLRIIPKIASDLPPNSQKVPWPAKLVEDAQKRTPIRDKFGNVTWNLPLAYFLDKNGEMTTSLSQAKRLFVNIPTGTDLYSQEVRPQPDWLNSTEGVMLMLRACLGDYMALFDPLLKKERILDPCLSCIILNSAIKVGLFTSQQETQQACDDCKGYLQMLRDIIAETQPAPPPPPPDAGIPPM